MAAYIEVNELKDVQSEKDLRHIPLKHVGIKDLRWPIELRDREHGTQHSVAKVLLAVDLPHDMRGTHMSRFVECMRELGPVGLGEIEGILDHLKEHLHGHTYKLVVKVEGTPDHEGMVIDFIKLKNLVKEEVLVHLDHACLNDVLPVPSAENISVWVWQKLEKLLASDHYHLYEVEVWETRTSGCVYRGE